MEAILYVGHGTRARDGKEQLSQFINKLMLKIDAPIQEISFIELTEPSIEAGIATCVRKKATRVTLIPLLLFSGGHAKHDIPLEIERAKVRFPHIHFSCGRPFGDDERFTFILDELLREQGFLKEAKEEASILLVGRGSSDLDVQQAMQTIGERLKKALNTESVDVCYLAAAKPSFEQRCRRILRSPYRKVYILPYLLFTGLLLKRIEKSVAHMRKEQTETSIYLCKHLGYHQKLINVVAEYVEEIRSS